MIVQKNLQFNLIIILDHLNYQNNIHLLKHVVKNLIHYFISINYNKVHQF